ncbi:MAG: hypothetical protein HOV81_36165 [Kofleriaceae bacterium]|nr:hypothetical protein [Kofleriaceae bacterium]
MRSLGLLVALGACADSGAHLTFVAPEGPADAQAYRVVLATPDPVVLVPDQRTDVAPAAATQTVAYYRQRTTAGESVGKVSGVDGLTLRLAPEGDFVDTTFVPFVLFYDGDGAIVGIGTYHQMGAKDPAAILVVSDEIDKYEVAVEPVTQVTDKEHPAPGQVMVVDCYKADQSKFASGIVWRPKAGGELRLMFPDDGGLDATGRDLDLDCDAHPVTAESAGGDCDDSRGWFHRDAAETCDGYDTNCDGLQSLAVACPATANVCVDASTSSGIAICDDRTGTVGACQSDPGCVCAADPTKCTSCKLGYDVGSSAGTIKPCQPGIGVLGTQNRCELGPCTVDVLAVRGPWKVEVAAPSSSPAFGPRATNITTQVMIKAKYLSGSDIMAVPGAAVGEVDLLVTSGNTQHYLGVQLQTVADSPGACQGTNGSFAMECTP